MISVIIPTCDEAAELPATLAAVRAQEQPHEILVVDAGSTDATAAIARAADAAVIASPQRQRAAQMNLGARAARGNAFLFLHADTRVAAGALGQIERALADPRVVGGGFARRYDSPSLFLRLTCAVAEARTRFCGWFLGDQAIFVRRTIFEELGGFRERDSFEDLDFARRMSRLGRVVTLRPAVISAARRFIGGAMRTTWRDLTLTMRYVTEHRHPASARGTHPAGPAHSSVPAGSPPTAPAESLCSK